MPVRWNIAAAAALALSACASLPPGQPVSMRSPEPVAESGPDFTDQGRIQFTPAGTPGAGAAWDSRSVRGPAVNLSLTDEGLWGGTLRDHPVLLRAGGGRITGEGVNVHVTQEGPVVHVQGMWFGSMLRVDVSPTRLSASPTAGVCGIEMALTEDGYFRGFGGCGGRLSYTWMTLEGVAADPSAEMPQWLFAFLAALPSPQTTVFPVGAFAAAGGMPSWFLPAEFRGYGWNAPGASPWWLTGQRWYGPWIGGGPAPRYRPAASSSGGGLAAQRGAAGAPRGPAVQSASGGQGGKRAAAEP